MDSTNPNQKRSTTTRQFVGVLLPVICGLCLSGCQVGNLFQASAPPIPTVFQATPGTNELVAAIRGNTESVRQLNSNVKVVMDGMPASASGTLLIERPQNLRLKVGILGMTDTGIDIGSNQDRFWIFNKSSLGGSRPAIYFARHREYEHSAIRQTIQLRPQWLIDAMGLVQFDPSETVESPFQRDGNLELYTTLPTANGNLHRVITVAPRTGIVLQQALYDGNNRLLGWSRSSKHRYFPEHNVSLPQHIELTAVGPDGNNMKLSVQIQSHTINSLYVDPTITWSMPRPADVPQVDLTRVDPAALQQTFSPLAGPDSHSSSEANQAYPDSRRKPFRLGRLRGFDLRSPFR